MANPRKEGADGRLGSNEGKYQNGSRTSSGFRTDTAISNSRQTAERTLKRWVPDASAELDGSLESSSTKGGWDQFAENERLFGLKTDYDENIYTTAIDKSHPQYSERLAAAERKAREIEKSAPTTAHVAEERVMDFSGGDDGGDEEDKYSGVRRQQELQPNRGNKYTPPARRAPASHSTVLGAPVDPAIISSQIKGSANQGSRKQSTPKPDESKSSSGITSSPLASAFAVPQSKTPEPKDEAQTTDQPSHAGGATTGDGTLQTDTKTAANAKQGQAAKVPTEANRNKLSANSSPAAVGTLRATATPGRSSLSPGASKPTASTTSSTANSPAPPNATETVPTALLKEFKDFASQQRLHAEKARSNKLKADAQSKLQELKKFANNFKLSTPVPNDLISIIAKDPLKQKQIQEKARQNVEELAKAKAEGKSKTEASPSSVSAGSATPSAPTASAGATPATNTTPVPRTASRAGTGRGPETATGAPATAGASPAAGTTGVTADSKATSATFRPQGSVQNANHTPAATTPTANNGRQPFVRHGERQQTQTYRGGRQSGGQHIPQGHTTGNLAERIRNADQNRYAKQTTQALNHGQQHFGIGADVRPLPPGPVNAADPSFSRRLSALPTGGHVPPKLNPSIHEFRPSPFAVAFNPNGPSTGSSPRSTVNNMALDHIAPTPSSAATVITVSSPRATVGVLVRRKTRGVDPKKCQILTFIRTIKAPQGSGPGLGRNWDDNDGLRPAYDTPPSWRKVMDDERVDSTMHLTYKEYLERVAFSSTAVATPVQTPSVPHGIPQMSHYQIPVHLQQQQQQQQQHGGQMAPRASPHIPQLPMGGSGASSHGHATQGSFNSADDHRMMVSHSAQSYASPRLAQSSVYPQQVGATPQMTFSQPGVSQFMPNAPQMNQYRSFSNGGQQYMSPQHGPMIPIIPPQQFVAVPGGIMPSGQQVPGYTGTHQFMGQPGANGAVGGGPPQQMGGPNGYPSPSRPVAAPMAAPQVSQQGQPMYGMSPNLQYQQPSFTPQHMGQGGHMRGGFNNPGGQHFGTNQQHVYQQHGPPHRNGGGNHGGKNYQNQMHNQNSHHHGPPLHHQPGHGVASATPGLPIPSVPLMSVTVRGGGSSEESK